MGSIHGKKILIWIFLTLDLIGAFLFGLLLPVSIFFIPALIILIYFILRYFEVIVNVTLRRERFVIWIYLTLNLLFAFIISSTIPSMEEETRYNMAYVMIPLLVIFNYIILNRFYYQLKCVKERIEDKIES